MCGQIGTDCKICSSKPDVWDICNDGFIIGANARCQACFTGCKTCTLAINANACSSCIEGYRFEDVSKKCFPCSDGCSICSATDKCTKCQQRFSLEGNSCILSGSTGTNWKLSSTIAGFYVICNDGYLIAASGKCFPCFLGCKTCTSSLDVNTCSSCFEGHLFNIVNRSCSPCSDGCTTCTSSNQCIACKKNFSLEAEVCVLCGQTGTNCKFCSITPNVCDVCNDGFYLDANVYKCFACLIGCKTCV